MRPGLHQRCARGWALSWAVRARVCRYDEELRAELAAAPLVRTAEEAGNAVGDVRLQYDSQPAYERHAAYFGMLQEWRDGVPRGGYNGTVRCGCGCSPIIASCLGQLPARAQRLRRPVRMCWWPHLPLGAGGERGALECQWGRRASLPECVLILSFETGSSQVVQSTETTL